MLVFLIEINLKILRRDDSKSVFLNSWLKSRNSYIFYE